MAYYAETGRSRLPNRLTLRITSLLLVIIFVRGCTHIHKQHTHKYIHLKISFSFSYVGHLAASTLIYILCKKMLKISKNKNKKSKNKTLSRKKIENLWNFQEFSFFFFDMKSSK